jgi:hypothetical protein
VLVASLGASIDLARCDPGVVMELGGALSQEASFLSAQEMLCQKARDIPADTHKMLSKTCLPGLLSLSCVSPLRHVASCTPKLNLVS